MALADGSNKIQYTVSTATTDFDFPYKYWDATDLVVTIVNLTSGNEETLDYNAGDYTVNATNGDSSLGATIVTAVSYDDDRVTIERIIAIESESDFVRGDGLPPDALNSEFDKAAAQRQQLDDQVGRQLTHPASDPDGLNYEAPTAENRASKATGWDASGNVTAIDLAESGTIGVDENAGLDLTNNIISAKINTDVMEFDSGDINVKDGGISTAKIADDAVSTAKIADDAVTYAKIQEIASMKVVGNMTVATATQSEVAVLDEDDMASDSDTSLSTQQSIKAYTDSSKLEYAMKYYGETTPVHAGPMPTLWADLDLSSVVGANRSFVVLAVDADIDAAVFFRKNGDTRRPYDTSTEGAGISGGSCTTDSRIYATMVTDAAGVVEWQSSAGAGTSTDVYLISYQKIFEA